VRMCIKLINVRLTTAESNHIDDFQTLTARV